MEKSSFRLYRDIYDRIRPKLNREMNVLELAGFHTYHKWNTEEFSAFISEHDFEVIHQETLGGSLVPLCYLTAGIRKIRNIA